MNYQINEIRLEVKDKESELISKIAKKLNIDKNEISNVKIIKKSIDSRHKNDVHIKYNCTFCCEKNLLINKFVKIAKEVEELKILKITKKITSPIIIGTGPAGLFLGLILAKSGVEPILVEQGKNASARAIDVQKFWEGEKLNTSSNVQFGFGGAGTFSDGKVNSGITSPFAKFVLETFVEFGAPKEILYSNSPHIGTDKLIIAIQQMQNKIESLGGKFLFEHKFVDFESKNNKITKAILENNGKKIEIETNHIILCIGHSARETFSLLKDKNVEICPKPFSVGLRIQHKQKDISTNQYGKFAEFLPPADYKLSTFLKNGRAVYTFCNCPGGYVVNASSEYDGVVCNGMSYCARDSENSNSAILVSVGVEDFKNNDALAGVEFQIEIEHKAFEVSKSHKLPTQLLKDFYNNKVSAKFGKIQPMCKGETVFADLNNILPKFVCDGIKEGIKQFDKKIKGFAQEDAILTGVETRSSSPVRITRNENFETNISGLFSGGEGAGYAGGIMSASVDGIKIALKIIENIK